MDVSWAFESFFLYRLKDETFFFLFATFLGCQEPYHSLEEPPLGLFWICQALYLLGGPLVQHLLVLKVSISKERNNQVVTRQARLAWCFPLMLLLCLGTSQYAAKALLSLLVLEQGQGLRQLLNLAHVGHPLQGTCWEPSLYGKDMRGGSKHLAFRLEMGQQMKKVSL